MADPATRYDSIHVAATYAPHIALTPFLSPHLVVQRGQGQGLPQRSLQRTPLLAFQMALPLLRGVSLHYLFMPTALVLKMRRKIACSRL